MIRTQTEQEADLESLRLVLPASMTAERCRHESNYETALWVYDASGQQIGVIKHPRAEGWHQWTAQSIWRGTLTCGGFDFSNLSDCITHIAERNARNKRFS